jgi:hypothetical protein
MHRSTFFGGLAATFFTVLALGAALAPAQALPAQGLNVADEARAMRIVDEARWRYVGWHRYWWRRWRRY